MLIGHSGHWFILESSVVLGESEASMAAIQARFADITFAADVASKKRVVSTLNELDADCERGLDLIHKLQQRGRMTAGINQQIQKLVSVYHSLGAELQVWYENSISIFFRAFFVIF